MVDPRVYFMLKPPPAVLPVLADQRRAVGLPDNYGLDRLHSTLAFIGSLDALGGDIIPILQAAGASIRARPFHVVFDHIHGNALYGSEPIRGLLAFRRLLLDRLEAYGVPVAHVPARPHISLAYNAPKLPLTIIDPISWTVEDFLLIESLYGQGRHIERGRWQLGRD